MYYVSHNTILPKYCFPSRRNIPPIPMTPTPLPGREHCEGAAAVQTASHSKEGDALPIYWAVPSTTTVTTTATITLPGSIYSQSGDYAPPRNLARLTPTSPSPLGCNNCQQGCGFGCPHPISPAAAAALSAAHRGPIF
ncbi:hypothetical protein E2C01_077687 [Portunus trituberculatus]|uniref:Uncharacterized protein n=1 Tax=Portunus trituberculatus TaxID=210409 RepID=A0A5B7IQD2_PORTR|nr:hypothetical protein [Portunus trituberculatus]